MTLQRDDVKKVARLARLHMNDAQLDKMAPELNKIIGFVEQLAELDTDSVEPLANVARKTLPLRADAVTDGGCRDKVLSNAPESVEGYFVVPKIIE